MAKTYTHFVPLADHLISRLDKVGVFEKYLDDHIIYLIVGEKKKCTNIEKNNNLLVHVA